jgi:RNA polymerase sigma-70 factor (ECF subfamily)
MAKSTIGTDDTPCQLRTAGYTHECKEHHYETPKRTERSGMTSPPIDILFPLPESMAAAHVLVPIPASWSHGCEQTGSPTTCAQAASSDPNEHDLDDESLMLAISQGAQWALERVYQRYFQPAYSLAYRMVRESTMAEDIVQEAFFSLWRKASSYQPQQGSVRTWLLAIVRHRAIDTMRATAHRETQWTPFPMENEHELSYEQPEVWEQAWRQERAEIIHRALAQLPPEQRQVIELSYFVGYTQVEIAERWNIPLGTVKGRIRLGLRKMEHLLCQQGIENGLS